MQREVFITDKPECAYLSKIDKCTKLFHSLAAIIKEDRTPTNSQMEVATEFLGYYHNLLGTNSACDAIDRNIYGEGPSLFRNMWNPLLGIFLYMRLRMICSTLRMINPRDHMDTVHTSLIKLWRRSRVILLTLLLNFSVPTHSLNKLTTLFVPLILKGSHSSTDRDFKPISCCNVVYKAIAKSYPIGIDYSWFYH